MHIILKEQQMALLIGRGVVIIWGKPGLQQNDAPLSSFPSSLSYCHWPGSSSPPFSRAQEWTGPAQDRQNACFRARRVEAALLKSHFGRKTLFWKDKEAGLYGATNPGGSAGSAASGSAALAWQNSTSPAVQTSIRLLIQQTFTQRLPCPSPGLSPGLIRRCLDGLDSCF